MTAAVTLDSPNPRCRPASAPSSSSAAAWRAIAAPEPAEW